jgi:two-component system cell cycle response regulator
MATMSNSDQEKKLLAEFTCLNNELVSLQRELVQKNVALEKQIAENEKLHEKLICVEREKVLLQTAGATAHEINQPLTIIWGLSQLIMMQYKDDTPLVEMINEIYEATQKINHIITKMHNIRTVVTKPYIGNIEIIDFNPPEGTVPE